MRIFKRTQIAAMVRLSGSLSNPAVASYALGWGLFAGGTGNVGADREIDGIDFSNDTAINPTIALSVTRSHLSGMSSSTNGYAVGGHNGTVGVQTITKYTYILT